MTHMKHEETRAETQKTAGSAGVFCGEGRRGGLLWGGALTLGGLVFLLHRLDVLPWAVSSPWSYWPVLLVWAGLVILFPSKEGFSFRWGVGFLAAGGILLASNLGQIELHWGILWPVLIIALGLCIMWDTFFGKPRRHCRHQKEISDGRFDTHIFMGSREDRVVSREFEGGSISCVMGGMELDLRNAEILEETAGLDVSLVMGGISLFVPSHWEVETRCTPVLGGVENKTRRQKDSVPGDRPVKRLIITGTVVMGGLEIHL